MCGHAQKTNTALLRVSMCERDGERELCVFRWGLNTKRKYCSHLSCAYLSFGQVKLIVCLSENLILYRATWDKASGI